MEVHAFLGWDGEDAMGVLKALKVVPESDPLQVDVDFDPTEFSVSDAGIKYIQNELDMINRRFGTYLEWRMYEDESFVLVWRNELAKSIGDPNDPPIQRFFVDHHKGSTLHELAKHFDIPCNPVVMIVTDASEFYHNYIYSD
jgi:hypothetical protein